LQINDLQKILAEQLNKLNNDYQFAGEKEDETTRLPPIGGQVPFCSPILIN
jgi:hypothetical protein